MKRLCALLLAMLLLFSVTACSNSNDTTTDTTATPAADDSTADNPEETGEVTTDGPVVLVGSKNFTSQLILGQIIIQALEANGIECEDVGNVGGSATCRAALEDGSFSIYYEYTGTAWNNHLKHDDILTDPEDAYQKVKEEDEANGIIWLDPMPANDTYCLTLTKEKSEELGITTISELAAYMKEHPGELKFAGDQEFVARLDGLPGLSEMYGFDFGENISIMSSGIVFPTIADGQCDVGEVFANDARIRQYDLVVLEDDLQFFPCYNGAPNVRADVLEAYPQIADILNPISAQLTDEVMIDLAYQCVVEGMEPSEAVEGFLTEIGVLG
jgi:osmoprotectant transport system substrate-binding protein